MKIIYLPSMIKSLIIYFTFSFFFRFCYCDEFIRLPLLMPDVQPKKPDSYICTAFRLPRNKYYYITEFIPNASMNTAHHIIIYGCEIPGYYERDTPRVVWNCGEMASLGDTENNPVCAKKSQILYAWAMDAPKLVLPENVGFKVGGQTSIAFLVLQVHYSNIDKFVDSTTDNSGIILTLLKGPTNLVTKEAGVFLLGTSGFISPFSIEKMEVICKINQDIEMNPFAFRVHTHKLGKVVSGWRVRNETWDLIGKQDPQKPQMFYSVSNPLKIKKGDILAVRCTMDNYKNKELVKIGPTRNDEMCNFYIMYYVNGGELSRTKYCFSLGPPTYFWKSDSRIKNVPENIDIEASIL